MLHSPIQLKEMLYIGVKVWPNIREEWDNQIASQFDFHGVEIIEYINTQILDDENDPLLYALQLRIAIENKKGKLTPYDIDIAIHGNFSISEEVKKEDRENMVTINGLAILYSAIRDQVMAISSRCVHGIFILPTVNFLDKKKEKQAALKDKKITKKKTTRKTATKKI